MGKSVIINQGKLLMLKENVASNDNVASHEDICVNEAAPEVDKYEIGVEEDSLVGGAYYHVNESTNFDTSEIGGVNYSWDFDEEEYQEWLADCEYENTQESLMEYINDNVEFELEYLDNETFHECGRDYVDYNTLEDMFGSRIQNEILTTCMNNGSGSFETIEMFSDDDVDINNQNSVNDIAMKLLRHGDYFKDCRGFILTNGVVVYTESEHNEICKIPNVNNKFDFIRMGNIRVLSQSIDIGAEPTSEQRDVLRRVIASYSDEELYLDIYQGKSCIGVRYIRPQWRYVMGEIDRYFSEGIKPQGNDFYENKKPKKQIVENKYDELYNKASSDFMNFMKQGALKYGDNSWYVEQYMKFKHPEIKVDPKDIEIYKALEKKDREIFKLWNEEDDREEEESKKNIEYYDVIQLAVERYGITSSLSQAGYILPDGNLLSFGQDGYRDVDHRAIEGIYKENNIPIWSDEYRYNYVVDFMNHGAIRCDVGTGILDMTQEPTSEQYNTIKSFVRKAVDIDIDFTDDKGNTLHSVSYSDARPQQVVADIQRYYNEGIKPQGNMQYEGKKRKSVMMSESQIKLLMEGYRKNIPQEFIDMAVKFRKNKYTNWCVVDLVSVHRFPRYFEKKEVAVRYMKILRQFGDKPALINLDALNGINENVDFSTSNLITESQESKSIAAAKKLVMQRLDYNSQEADEFVRIKLRNDIPSLRTPQGGKFILGVTRMFCDGELRNANDIGNLNSTLKLVASDAHINEYDRNLNNLSCQELIQRFAKAMSDNLEAEKDEIGQMTFNSPSNYEIVRIDSFEQAEEYGDYVSWCVTHDSYMFDSYTSNGINQFYFCLKNGFENVEKVQSEGCPLDEYGLSMIAVSVNENGMLNTCTCRWNHDNGGDDSIMDAKEVSQVIGMNFFEVFKPNNKWKDLLDSVEQRLANGEDPRDVFEYVEVFKEGLTLVELNGKYSFINQEGKLLRDQWFDYVDYFKEGFARVEINDKYNFINQEGRFLREQWFEYVDDFNYGFAKVRLNDKYNFINQEGRFLREQWFEYVESFYKGFARVCINNKWNFINQEGRFISNRWFDYVDNFNDGFAKVKLNDRHNYINQEGRLLRNQWFDYACPFHEGFAIVKLNDKWNYINQEGRVISDQWFVSVGDFEQGFAKVRLNGKWCEIDTNGKLYEGKNQTKSIIISENKIKLLKENLDLEVDSSEIDLSSFKKKDELVPSIWDEDDKLNSKIRLKLLDIADDFWDFVNLKWVKPKGVILTGSICNFNWSKYSDIDLHIIADFNEIDEKTEFVRDYLDSKKNEWNNEHDALEIMGHKVELYVQNLGEMPKSNGIYDLEENDWSRHPNINGIHPLGLDKFPIKDKAANIMTIIDGMYDVLSSTDDSHKIEQMGDDANYLWKKIKELRKNSLEKDGEMGKGNVVYKILRREGYLDKLWKLKTLCYDKTNSISEEKKSKEILKEYLEKDNNLPLYRYFKWAFTASSCEKAKDLAYECGYYVERYIDQIHYRYQEFDELLEKYDGNFDYCDDEVIEAFCEILEKNNLCDHFISLMQSIVDYYELPSWCTMDFNRIVKNEWCIHFGADSESIAREGFPGGTPDFEHLAYTDAGQQKPYAGYNFAFLIDDRNVDYNEYGDEAVIFRTSGVEVFHYGDNQNQVVFWGPNVKSFIPIHQENGDWVVYGQKGQILFRGENPSDVANWATYNLPQYRKQIMTGKNGYIPKMGKWNSETNKYEIVPYPIYRNESISKYITLLKNNLINEEFALDGNTEHNPYNDRWKAEREALKNFICNNGTVMQSKEDNKEGKLYKVFWDKGISQLIGYNYCLCVQWDEIKLKPKSVVYVRAMDKFSPNIRRNVTFDNRGLDNQAGTWDDVRY